MDSDHCNDDDDGNHDDDDDDDSNDGDDDDGCNRRLLLSRARTFRKPLVPSKPSKLSKSFN